MGEEESETVIQEDLEKIEGGGRRGVTRRRACLWWGGGRGTIIGTGWNNPDQGADEQSD